MAKLHSEIRIKAVNGIAVGNEGQGDQFAEGDIIFNNANGEFMKRNNSAYDAGDAAASWDVVSGGGGGGAGDQILEGNTKVEVIDAGSDGRIEFTTENTKKWEISTSGNLLPAINNSYDIGSAEKKVRDLYVSDSSLWVGDEHKIMIDGDQMKFRRRRYASGDAEVPPSVKSAINGSSVGVFDGVSTADVTEAYVTNDGTVGYVAASLANPANLSQMTLAHWEHFASWANGIDSNIMQNGLQSVFVTDQDFIDNFRPGESADGFKPGTGRDISGNQLSGGDDMELPQSGKGLSGITYMSQTHSSSPIVFHVGVDNKSAAHPWAGQGSGMAYYINGQESPFLKLAKGVYHFDVSHVSNATHPFKLYTAADKAGGPWSTEIGGANNPSALSVEFWEGGTQRDESTYNSVVGQAGVYLKVTIASDSPQILHYQCSSHPYMGYEIKNESAVSASGGGAVTANDLNDVSTGGVQDGDALVYDGANFSPKPILSQEDAFASDRVTFSADNSAPELVELHSNIQGHSGGRIVIDTTNLGNNAGDKINLDLSELYDPADPLLNTMNFEIYSVGTQPFSVEVANSAGGPATGQQILHSDMQADIIVNENATSTISLGEGQMLIIYCDADTGWYLSLIHI